MNTDLPEPRRLLGSITSPFVRKVRIVLSEMDIDIPFKLVDVKIATPELLRVAPIGKIPVLETSELPLYESDTIVTYLAEYRKEDRWFPACFDMSFAHYMALINSGMDAAAGIIMESWRSPGEDRDLACARLTGRLIRILRSLHSLDPDEVQHVYLQVSLFSLLAYLDFRRQIQDWRELCPHLENWFIEFSERPSAFSTAPC